MKDSLSVATIDTLVAKMSGLIIFPAVYSIDGLSPDAGPSLVFITLPNVFQQVFELTIRQGGADINAGYATCLRYAGDFNLKLSDLQRTWAEQMLFAANEYAN